MHLTRAPQPFTSLIFIVFGWIIVGICVIYGIRLWFNSPISMSFLPITGAAFSASLAFTLVLALEHATGPIKVKLGSTEFQGASGPIILWCICFFVITFGLYMLGMADVVKLNATADQRSVLRLILGAQK